MSFRERVRKALASPLGGPLARLFAIPAVTAIVADAQGSGLDRVALSELSAAMAGVGVPPGRTFVLLSGEPSADARERARALRAELGLPVMAQDPSHAAFVPGSLADGSPLELDDELREAEAIVVVGRIGADSAGRLRGGPAALLPGVASRATREAQAVRLAARADAASRASAAWREALDAASLAPVDFALLWNDADPPEVLAGEGPAVFAACADRSWHLPSPGRPRARGAGGA
ncbi:MAG: hypothetical protein IT347_00395 [Candidatus Eisenbacteria bacterium]|nr:hypothetical protein [Candidatus Eisenbacteria bacterium]